MLNDSSYKLPFCGAVVLHIGVLLFFTIRAWHAMPLQSYPTSSVTPIKAVAVSNKQISQQLAAIAAAKERKRQARLAQIRRRRAHILVLKRHKLLLLKKRQEAAQRRRELVKQQEIKRRNTARHALMQKLQKQLQHEVAATAKQMSAAHAKQVQSEVAKYKALIVQAIAQNWLVPPKLSHNISCQLLIDVAPGGTVLSVKLLKSSGDSRLDRSAQAAVWQASPLPVPSVTEVFDNFRELRLTVYPKQTGGWNYEKTMASTG